MDNRSLSPSTAIPNILTLRRAERVADPLVRDDLARVREYLEGLVGPTVRPAQAARSLGVSHPALKRWMDGGEIAAVRTAEGRREIPLSELLDLLEEIERARRDSSRRPLERVIHERHRRSVEAIDFDRLFPRQPRGHRTAELQALAYHRVVAQRLDERLVEKARRRLHRWREEDRIHPHWADEWEKVVSMPLESIVNVISADDPYGTGLRQTSPFAGVLTEQERRRLLKAVEERL